MRPAYRSDTMGGSGGCLICGRPLSFHQRIYNGICGDWRCKAALLDREKSDYRKLAAQALGIDHPDFYPIVVVPDDPADIGPQPETRKQAHIDFLYELCVEAAVCKDDDNCISREAEYANLETPDGTASRVCAVCRGTCCHMGKTEAFLDRAAIHRFMALTAICDPLEIVYAYFARLPEVAVAEGCVYQTAQGCTLPRWMRSDLCNAYRCQGLRQAERMIRRENCQCLCVVAREDNRITRSAFIRNGRIYPYPLSAPAEADSNRQSV
ncbi:hypothetical protein [uncultured Desulfosarcina sp.]|uniref:hypothetical protein n=1 Tax=uncultured Desulfosarcina sp. TaxID=218289 RepID=UPI0029C6F54F|nr:hypothetical protein [uncultured Desulfosarcina sp.]